MVLKYNHKASINAQAAGNLQPTDWMVVRAAEGGTAVPSIQQLKEQQFEQKQMQCALKLMVQQT